MSAEKKKYPTKPLFSEFIEEIKKLESSERLRLVGLSLLIFIILFTYPLVRSTTTAIFLDKYGASNTPLVWVFSVLALSFCVGSYNFLQEKMKVVSLFAASCALSVVIFVMSLMLLPSFQVFAFLLYVWKEVYIILLVHMTLAFLNTSLSVDLAKIIYGPFGAIGSLGGLLGGLLTSKLASSYEVATILYFACSLIALSAVVFVGLGKLEGRRSVRSLINKKMDERKNSPIGSLREVYPYIICLCLVIVWTQFCVNLANFRFNVVFDELVTTQRDKTLYLGLIYSSINALSLTIQLIVVPIVLSLFRIKTLHFVIPVLYFGLIYMGLIGEVGTLLLVSVAFAGIKGVDYSLFSAIKELLYFSLNAKQKYGAKYLVDMFFYRFGKGLISFILIFFQSAFFVNTMMILSLVFWVITLVPLFLWRPNDDNFDRNET